MRTRLVVVSAGLSQPSSTRLLADRLAAASTEALRAGGVEAKVEVVELRELAHAVADHLLTGFPAEALEQTLAAVASADAVIAVTPVFSASYSGLFKSFFDILDERALDGTPVLLAATAGTPRHSLVLEHAMRPLFSHLRAAPVPTAVFAATEDFASGSLKERIERAAAELADAVLRRPRLTAADPFEEVTPFEQLLGA